MTPMTNAWWERVLLALAPSPEGLVLAARMFGASAPNASASRPFAVMAGCASEAAPSGAAGARGLPSSRLVLAGSHDSFLP
jgi:hypothetical protein